MIKPLTVLVLLFAIPAQAQGIRYIYNTLRGTEEDTCNAYIPIGVVNYKIEKHRDQLYINFGAKDSRGYKKIKPVLGEEDLKISQFKYKYESVSGSDCSVRMYYEFQGIESDTLDVYHFRRWQCEGYRACNYSYTAHGSLKAIRYIRPYRPNR